jgi:hypothetical protein
MSIKLTATNDDYIILTQNKINTFNEGTKILLKTHVISVTSGNIGENGANEDYDVLNAVNTRLPYLPNYTNNIILSYKNGTSINCLLTLNNIKNNIKFLFTDNNKKNGKILFVKNTNINNYELSNNYLLNTKTTSNLNINLAFQLNYHFNNIYSNSSSNFYNNNTINNPTNPNYDYYKINIKDYISRDYSYNFFGTTNDICYNNLYFKINSAHNNLYLDSDVSFRRLSDISNISQLRKVDNLSDFSPIYNISTLAVVQILIR